MYQNDFLATFHKSGLNFSTASTGSDRDLKALPELRSRSILV